MNQGPVTTRLVDLRDWFRDPLGWLMDALPWPLRRYLVAWRLEEKPSEVPDAVAVIGWRKPPWRHIKALRRLDRLE